MSRLATFLQTLCQVIHIQRKTWVKPAIELGHRIEQEYFSPAPTVAVSSGLIAQLNSSVPWDRDRNVPRRLLKSLLSSKR